MLAKLPISFDAWRNYWVLVSPSLDVSIKIFKI